MAETWSEREARKRELRRQKHKNKAWKPVPKTKDWVADGVEGVRREVQRERQTAAADAKAKRLGAPTIGKRRGK